MRRMLVEGADEFYYVTVMNENYPQPSMPAGVEDSIIRGMYLLPAAAAAGPAAQVHLLGSGAVLREVLVASDLLRQDWQISATVWSVTSFTELAREAREVGRWNRLHPQAPSRRSYVAECLSGGLPIVAATDYVCAYAQSIAPYVDSRLIALGTDGFGRSDTRTNLRRFFEVDRHHITLAALQSLVQSGEVSPSTVSIAIERYGIEVTASAPWLT
jgi:pyruvate dehydrogenase E1 component